MIAHLTGILISFSHDSITLDVNGVGYEIFISTSTLEKLKMASSPISLFIHTAVREDSLSLFGFLSFPEKQLFLKLISVSGIGPKLAINILSKIAVEDLIQAIY